MTQDNGMDRNEKQSEETHRADSFGTVGPFGTLDPDPPGKEVSALDSQVGGDHYKLFGIQPIEYITANELSFLQGCIIKRITRFNQPTGKGLEDLEKIKHEVDLLIELTDWVEEEETDLPCDYSGNGSADFRPDGGVTIPPGVQHVDLGGPPPVWIDWEGGECPVDPDTAVSVMLRDVVDESGPEAARNWRWGNTGKGGDIVAYRVVDD